MSDAAYTGLFVVGAILGGILAGFATAGVLALCRWWKERRQPDAPSILDRLDPSLNGWADFIDSDGQLLDGSPTE